MLTGIDQFLVLNGESLRFLYFCFEVGDLDNDQLTLLEP
jgi:hypothetical protein